MKNNQTNINATIKFDNVIEVLVLENGLRALLKNEKIDNFELKELNRLFDLIGSLTGNSTLTYWLENRK